MPLNQDEFSQVIESSFKEAKFILIDMLGDKNHYSLEITSPEFTDLSLLESHRLINSKLKNYIGTQVHALTILSVNVI